MSKADKREQRIRNNPDNVSIVEFEALIMRYGKIVESGSHPKAIIGGYVFSYKRKNPMSACYVENILKIIDGLEEARP